MNYFEETDFKCRCGCDQATVHAELLNMLNVARWKAGIPFFVKSGFRCEAHNKSVGGKPTSAHLKGLAADIHTHGSRGRYLVLTGLIYAGFTRIGIGAGFIHVDIDPDKDPEVMWPYLELKEISNV